MWVWFGSILGLLWYFLYDFIHFFKFQMGTSASCKAGEKLAWLIFLFVEPHPAIKQSSPSVLERICIYFRILQVHISKKNICWVSIIFINTWTLKCDRSHRYEKMYLFTLVKHAVLFSADINYRIIEKEYKYQKLHHSDISLDNKHIPQNDSP